MDISALTEISLNYLATNWITLVVGISSTGIAGYYTYVAAVASRRALHKKEIVNRIDAIIIAHAPFVHPLNSPSLDERRALYIAYKQLSEYPNRSEADLQWADDYLGEHLNVLK